MKSVESKYQLLTGTGGKPDYLVVAKSKGAALGIKPLLHPIPGGGTFLGCRIRCAFPSMPDELVDADDPKTLVELGEELPKRFPLIEWGRVDNKRCSVIIGVQLDIAIVQLDLLREAINNTRFHWKVVDWLKAKVDEDDFVISVNGAVDWMKAKFDAEFKQIEEAMPSGKYDPDVEVEYEETVFKKLLAKSKEEAEEATKKSPTQKAVDKKGFKIIDGGKPKDAPA